MKAYAAAAAVVALCAAVLIARPPGTQHEVEEDLALPFEHLDSGAYSAPIGEAAAASAKQRDGLLLVLEDGREVESQYRRAMAGGQGGDTRATARVEFKGSDASDPNVNGRTYTLHYRRAAVPAIVYLVLIGAAACVLFVVCGSAINRRLAARPLLRRGAAAVVSLVLLAALLQLVGTVLVADRLPKVEPIARDLYEQIFLGREVGGDPGSSAVFREHHYLDFALNPDAVYMNERQFNAHYRIRRKEPIRPRTTWRALALGGSTTFGERTAREEDTWVYRLEHKIRARYGAGYDVINGGVGGYNVVENFLHYILLLQDLDPDLVILYVGINDVHPRLIGNIEPDYANSRMTWRPEAYTKPRANPLLAPLSLYRFAMLRRLEAQAFVHIYMLVQQPYPPESEWAAALQRNGSQVYRRHLENLVRLLLAQGRRVVVVPQVFLPRPGDAADAVFGQGVAEHNQVNQTVARELHVPYVTAVAAPTAFARRDLLPYDNCHFNEAGHEKMAQLLFQFLAAEHELPAGAGVRQ